METQLDILSQSLDEKIKVLHEIQKYNAEQEKSFQDGQADMDTFDAAIEKKGKLIDKINLLDAGFETTYERLAAELQVPGNRAKYADKIATIQKKIAQVTELSVSIQAQEKRNKKLVEDYFSKQRERLHQSRKNSKAAYDYYKSMSGANYVAPQMFDNKQ